LKHLPNDANVIINASQTVYIAHDILDMIREFRDHMAVDKNIKLTLIGFEERYNLENSTDTQNVWIESSDEPIRAQQTNK
jgi:hypothetical protein